MNHLVTTTLGVTGELVVSLRILTFQLVLHLLVGVLSYKQDQVWRHKDGLPAGYKMHWLLPTTQINGQLGQWSSSNASSGF